MQIVIDIDEYIFERATKNLPMYPTIVDVITNAIKEGTPLPKNHGRLPWSSFEDSEEEEGNENETDN